MAAVVVVDQKINGVGVATISPDRRHQQAHEARGQVERALDLHGWPWRPSLSRWLDALVILEELDA